MNLPLPEADAATAAEVRDWLDRFAACVREVDYAAARPFFHPDIVIFGTYQELVKSLSAWTERQWDNVWPRTAEFRFDLENTMVMAAPDRAMAVAIADSMEMERPSTVRAGPRSCWRGSRTGAGSAFIRTCRWRAACRRIATANAP
jgi:ketosteroid isomerase-like protein